MALSNEQIVQVLTDLSPQYPDWNFRIYYSESNRLFWAIEPFEGTFTPITVGFDDVADYEELDRHVQGALIATANYINPIAQPVISNLDELNEVGIGQEELQPGEYI